MPIQQPGKPTFREDLLSFTGINLRSDPTQIGQGQLASGLDLDMYEQPGTIFSRRGFREHFASGTPPVIKFLRAQDFLIHAGGVALFINGVAIGTPIDNEFDVDMVEFRGTNAVVPEVFIANGRVNAATGDGGMLRYGANLGVWGIAAPTDIPGAALNSGGSLTGTYSIKYTFVRKAGSVVVHESNPSPASGDVALTADDLDVTIIGSTDVDITHVRVYRPVAGGAIYLLDTEFENEAVVTGTLSKADGSLGAAVDEDNTPPEPATIAHALRNRIWTNDLARGNRLRYTARFLPERQPAANFIDIGSENHTITAIDSINGVLIVFTETTKFRIVEQSGGVSAVGADLPFIGAAVGIGSGTDFFALELPSSRGTKAPKAVVSTGFGIIYPTKEGLFVTSGGASAESLLSQKVQSLFIGVKEEDIPPIDFEFESNMAAEFYRGRYYLSYTSIESTDGTNDYTAIYDIAADEWSFWKEGFSDILFDDEDNRLLGGRADGSVDELETPGLFSDSSALTAITSSAITSSQSGGDIMTRKLFLYVRVDAEVDAGDTLTAEFFTDSTSRKTFTITGSRTRELLRLPSGSTGFTWKVKFSFTGTSQVKIHGVGVQWKGLTSS
jgi:hypothetical protein